MSYIVKPIYCNKDAIQHCKKQLTFEQIYLNILQEEVAKDYFTPASLLNDIVKKCFWELNKNGNLLIYDLNKIIQISNNQLKHKQKFLYALTKVKHKSDFAINIIYLKQNNKQTYLQIIQNYQQRIYTCRLF